jgi:hypothetical protein
MDSATEWEYKVETINTEYQLDENGDPAHIPDGWEIINKCLNDFGSDGWELVTFLPALPADDFRGNYKNPWVYHAIFKRPK